MMTLLDVNREGPMIFLRDQTLFGVDVRLSAYPVFSRMSFDVAAVNITPALPRG
jgi:hypothetical protein